MVAKGGAFEREIAKMLSLWWTEGEREDIFYRSHSSGARFTQRKKSGKDTALQAGDLTCSDPIGEPLIKIWNCEFKTGYGKKRNIRDANKRVVKKIIDRWDVLDILDSKQEKPVLIRMWEQCRRGAELTGRRPVLIFRRNNRRACIMITKSYLGSLCYYIGMFKENFCSISDNLVVMALEDFLNWAVNLPQVCKSHLIIHIM